jgi:hypothetical protein
MDFEIVGWADKGSPTKVNDWMLAFANSLQPTSYELKKRTLTNLYNQKPQ